MSGPVPATCPTEWGYWKKSPPVGVSTTLDVVNGLARLSATVSRARRFFASVQTSLKFNRTLLILLSDAINPTDDFTSMWPACAPP